MSSTLTSTRQVGRCNNLDQAQPLGEAPAQDGARDPRAVRVIREALTHAEGYRKAWKHVVIGRFQDAA